MSLVSSLNALLRAWLKQHLASTEVPDMACCDFFNQRLIIAPRHAEPLEGSSSAEDQSFSVKLKRKENESLGIVTTFLPEGDGLVIDWVSKDSIQWGTTHDMFILLGSLPGAEHHSGSSQCPLL